MAPKKVTKNIKKKLAINTLRQYFPSLLIKYNQHNIDKFPRDTKLNDENLMSVFRTMWNTNLLLKNMMNSNAVSEERNDNKSSVHMETTLKEFHKIIWKLNLLLKNNMMNSNAVSEERNDNKSSVHMETTLKELHKVIWKLNSLMIYEFRFRT